MHLTRRTARTVLARVAAVAAAGVVTAALAAPATAGTTADGEGWLRLAHLSPDTPDVDIVLTADGTSETTEYDGVGYADVSDYERLAPGSYTVAMVPSGSAEGTAPLVEETFEVAAGAAYTVAALGLQADLTARVITDDLQQPAEGMAHVRLIQASVSSETVDVVTDTGAPIATGVAFGSVTGYAAVGAGGWTLEVSGGDSSGVVMIELAAGSNNTLIAIDRDGELTVALVEDSSGAEAMPEGGVATGAGGLYHAERRQQALLVAGALVVVAGAVTLLVVRRQPAPGRHRG